MSHPDGRPDENILEHFEKLLHGMQREVCDESLRLRIFTLNTHFFGLLRQWRMIDHIIETFIVGSLLNGMLLFIVLLMVTVAVVLFEWKGITCVSALGMWVLLVAVCIAMCLLSQMVHMNSGRRDMTLSMIRSWTERLNTQKMRAEATTTAFSDERLKLQSEFQSLAQPLSELYDQVSKVERPVSICCDALELTAATRNRLLLTLLTSLLITLWSITKQHLTHEQAIVTIIQNSERTISHDIFGWQPTTRQ